MIGIIGAMAEEVEAIKKQIVNGQEKTISTFQFYEGTLENKSVVLMKSGIGKVNAAIGTTILFEHFPIDYVVNIGTAGGIKSTCEVCDIVLSDEVAYHDVDVTAFNYPYGQVPGMPLTYKADEKLKTLALKVLQDEHMRFHEGLIVSGDAFINHEHQIEKILDVFPFALAVEMEACAISQVCTIYQKPFVILRSLSDIAGKKSNISFDLYLHEASINSAKVVVQIVKEC